MPGLLLFPAANLQDLELLTCSSLHGERAVWIEVGSNWSNLVLGQMVQVVVLTRKELTRVEAEKQTERLAVKRLVAESVGAEGPRAEQQLKRQKFWYRCLVLASAYEQCGTASLSGIGRFGDNLLYCV